VGEGSLVPRGLLDEVYRDQINAVLRTIAVSGLYSDELRRREQHASVAEWEARKRDRRVMEAWRRMENQDCHEWVRTYMPAWLRPFADLHENVDGHCEGCDPGDYAGSFAYWPCQTWDLIEELAVAHA